MARRVALFKLILSHPMNNRHRAQAMARAIGWQAWRLTARRPLTVRFWKDLKVRVYPDWPYSWTAIYFRLTEYDDMMFTLRYLRPGDAFLDVGANIGFYSLLASSVNDGAPVLAYEPHPLGSSRLHENISLNQLQNVVVRPVAVGASTASAQLTAELFDENRILAAGEDRRGVEVQVVTLDDEIHERGLDPASVALVKIDTEGFEAQVLKGAGRLLDSMPGPVWLIEVSGLSERYGAASAEIDDVFVGRGYQRLQYVADEDRLLTRNEMPAGGNVIYAREPQAAVARLRGSAGTSPNYPLRA